MRDLAKGECFNLLTVVRPLGRRGKCSQPYYLCRCVCGNEREVNGYNLTGGKVKSCGCLVWKHGHSSGGKVSRTWASWRSMRERCLDPNHRGYAYWGGRGVTVCERWGSFENFLSDMGERPLGMTLDRIDNDGNYESGNCRWATPKQQILNSRSVREMELDGEWLAISEWAERFEIDRYLVYNRLYRGWGLRDALTRPVANRGQF